MMIFGRKYKAKVPAPSALRDVVEEAGSWVPARSSIQEPAETVLSVPGSYEKPHADHVGFKLERSAFVYMDPKPPKDKMAQCATCRDWIPDAERCFIHPADLKIDDDDSCGLYVHGEPVPGRISLALVTPEESGLVDWMVRCENCASFDGHVTCNLYKKLNQEDSCTWDLDETVDPHGCCNGFSPAEVQKQPDEIARTANLSMAADGEVDEMLLLQCLAAVPDFPIDLEDTPYYGGRIEHNGKVRHAYIVDFDRLKLANPDALKSHDARDDDDPMDTVEGSNSIEEPDMKRLIWGEYADQHPDVEVYIDCNISQHNWWPICVHETHESMDMEDGMPYEKAHDRANKVERIVRLRIAGEAQ